MDKEHLFLACDGLDGHKIVHDYVAPYSVFAKTDMIGSFFCGLLIAEEGHYSGWIFCEDGESAKEIRVRIFAETEKGRFATVH